MRALQLAMRMLGREWRSGELGILLLALTVAVAALTGVERVYTATVRFALRHRLLNHCPLQIR